MIIIINGSSGSGKTTAGKYLEEFGFERIITTTTREIREGEIKDSSYYFVTQEEFDSKEFIEKSVYAGNSYGTTTEEVEKKLNAGKDIFAVLDINGVRAFKEKFGDIVKVIYLKTSGTKIRDRMKKRGDSTSKIIERIKFRNESLEQDNIRFADYVINNSFSEKYLKNKVEKAVSFFKTGK